MQGSNISLLHSLFGGCKDEGKQSMCNVENADQIIVSLLLCATIKLLLTIITFGVKVPGGVFIPSLVIGNCHLPARHLPLPFDSLARFLR